MTNKKSKLFIFIGIALVIAAVVAVICVSCSHNTPNDGHQVPNNTNSVLETTPESSNNSTATPDTHVHEFVNPEIIKLGTENECIGIKRTCSCGQTEVADITTEHTYEANEPELVYKDGEAIGYKIKYVCAVCDYSYERMLSEEEIVLYNLDPIDKVNHAHQWETAETETTEGEYKKYLFENEKTDTVPVPDGYVSKYFKVVRTCGECGETQSIVERRDEPAPVSTTEPVTEPIPTPVEGDKECEHVYHAHTVPASCNANGYTEYVCEKCGRSYTADYTEALGHNYGNWIQTTAANCEHDGSKTRTCSRCGAAETQTIAKTSHTYSDWTVTKAATCGAAGQKTRTCKTCGKSESQTIAKLNHSYGNWTTTREASCEVNGEQTRTCTKCGHKETKAIAAAGHKWDNGTVNSSSGCGAGVKTYICSKCGKTKTEKVSGTHEYGDWIWDAYEMQFYEGGRTFIGHNKHRVCNKCGHIDTVTYKEHSCETISMDKGSDGRPINMHVYKEESDCQGPSHYSITCLTCGYVTEYYGETNPNYHPHATSVTRRVCEYTEYTDPIEETVIDCSLCGAHQVTRTYVYNEIPDAAVGISFPDGYIAHWQDEANPDFSHQVVYRNIVRGSDGRTKSFRVYWIDSRNGQRYYEDIDFFGLDLDKFLKTWCPYYGSDGFTADEATWWLRFRCDALNPWHTVDENGNPVDRKCWIVRYAFVATDR